MRLSSLIAAASLCLAGASCDPGELSTAFPAATRDDAIVGGSLASGDPAVVGFAVGDGHNFGAFCTGTLVAPKTVVTAAHCIKAEGANASYYVIFGTYDTRPTQAIAVRSQKAHPSYTGGNYDVGILELATPAVGVTPIEMNPTVLTNADVGHVIRHVGYGITAPNTQGSGTKREVTYNVRQIDTFTIESGASGKQTCQGDSGGPALMVTAGSPLERLVGTVSYGDQNCAQFGIDMRVDALLPWFRTQMAAWEDPACQSNGICDPACADLSLDPDCPRDCVRNGVCALDACPIPDPDCAATGAFCSSVLFCKSRMCVTDVQSESTYCSQTCSTNAECGDGLECASGTCRRLQKPERALNDTCSPTVDFCTNHTVCTGPTNGLTRCEPSCTTTADCSGGANCEGGQGGQRYCRPADVSFSRSISLPAALLDAGEAAPGCSTTPGVMPLLMGALLLLRRRRAM